LSPRGSATLFAFARTGPAGICFASFISVLPKERMPFSHHSHSGQFCHHADNTLEEVVKAAISKGMQTLVMTEHMPRDVTLDSYPEEVGFSAFQHGPHLHSHRLRPV
jgi:hypothetical protein